MPKTTKKLPTILGLLILICGLVAGIFLINSNQVFKLRANVEAIPSNVRFTNLTDSGVTVSWTTEIESKAFIKWGYSSESIDNVLIEENEDSSFVHSIDIIGLKNNSDIFITVNSNGKDYDNNNSSWQTKTLSSSQPANISIITSGTILDVDGETPAKALVYVTINGTFLSTVTSDEGSFIIPISNFVSNLSDSSLVEISVNDGKEGTSQALIYPYSLKNIPTILIGKTYDFRTLPKNNNDESPESNLSLPESVEISSRFEVVKSQVSDLKTFTIDSVNNGEIINTTDPEFFGTGPKNTTIEVKVESELQEATISTNSKGSWKWSPPNNLEPGEHKVTLKWQDASGIIRTLTRTFVVQASEGPAFESTPSAVLTPTPVATIKPTIAPVVETPKATLQPVPQTGSLTPTIGLFIMGVGVLMSSFIVYKKQDA